MLFSYRLTRSIFMSFIETISLDFELLAWSPDCFQHFNIASDLHFLIHKKFLEHNISIAFPQRDVHLYTRPERVSRP